jgi:ataxia telangiectasia mutated family protein
MQKASSVASLSQAWLRIWQLASRAIPSQSTAQAACYLLTVLLDLKIVQYHSVLQSLEYMLSMSELTGPGVLTESSTAFWFTFLRVKLSESPGSVGGMSEQLLRWIFSKWSPSE